LRLPFLRKIELNELPEIRVKRIIVATIIEVLATISKRSPFMVSDGRLTKRSKSMAKAAMKKEKKICP